MAVTQRSLIAVEAPSGILHEGTSTRDPAPLGLPIVSCWSVGNASVASSPRVGGCLAARRAPREGLVSSGRWSAPGEVGARRATLIADLGGVKLVF